MAYLHIGPAPARLIPMKDGTIGFESPYDPGLVAALKAAIPYSDRKWDRGQKLWFVAPQHAATLADLAEQYLGRRPKVPQMQIHRQLETRLLDVRYIGSAKERAGGQVTASGWVNGGWNAIFPEVVLKLWFAVDSDRAAARQWHPDVCKEPQAEEQFKRINEAYQVLSNSLQRRKYDAGLTLEQSITKNSQAGGLFGAFSKAMSGNVWRPPLRCGYILCSGIEQLGRFVVSEILQWEDIVNSRGQVLVTSWTMGDDRFTERWV